MIRRSVRADANDEFYASKRPSGDGFGVSEVAAAVAAAVHYRPHSSGADHGHISYSHWSTWNESCQLRFLGAASSSEDDGPCWRRPSDGT